jgi:hypothetical protein
MKVYFVQEGAAGPIKIGYAIDPEGRYRSLQTAHASELRLLLAIPGDIMLETYLHKRFASTRIRGEWFAPSADLYMLITLLQQPELPAPPTEPPPVLPPPTELPPAPPTQTVSLTAHETLLQHLQE